MRKKTLLTMITIMIMFFTLGCSKPSKEDILETLLSTSDDNYRINFFYEIYDEQYTYDLTTYWNSDEKLLEHIVIQVYNVNRETTKDIVDAMDIQEYPYYLVTDNNSVVLSTENFLDVKEYFQKSLNLLISSNEGSRRIARAFIHFD